MDFSEEFKQIMASTNEMALATSVSNQPNVRIVDFVWDEQANVLYFNTFNKAPKNAELAQNEAVAFTTITDLATDRFVRVTKATAKITQRPTKGLADAFIKKMPFFESIFSQQGLDNVVFYEIRFTRALVNVGMGQFSTIDI